MSKQKKKRVAKVKTYNKKTLRLSDIKTPTSVEEFKENLKKCFWSYGEDALFVKTDAQESYGISYKSINSLDDLYELTGTGFSGDGSSPMIIPKIDFDDYAVTKYMRKNNQTSSSEGFFNNDYKVYKNKIDCKNPSWCTLDNQILREFYIKVLGEFSGYA